MVEDSEQVVRVVHFCNRNVAFVHFLKMCIARMECVDGNLWHSEG